MPRLKYRANERAHSARDSSSKLDQDAAEKRAAPVKKRKWQQPHGLRLNLAEAEFGCGYGLHDDNRRYNSAFGGTVLALVRVAGDRDMFPAMVIDRGNGRHSVVIFGSSGARPCAVGDYVRVRCRREAGFWWLDRNDGRSPLVRTMSKGVRSLFASKKV